MKITPLPKAWLSFVPQSRPLKRFLMVFLASVGIAAASCAQDSPPYLKSATLYLAVNGWADIWLNGIPIRESQPSTPESKGFQTIQCLPKHLCYFQNENLLAIENANAFHNPAPLNGQIGLAYTLKLRFSDGSEQTLSSNEPMDHRAYYMPNREMGEPQGWQGLSFNDADWSAPSVIGSSIPGVASLADPETRQPIPFLSAFASSFKAQREGEKHLYRREFHLDISANPLCGSVKTTTFRKVVQRAKILIPTETFTPQAALPRPTLIPSPTETPVPAPVRVWKPTPVPTATATHLVQAAFTWPPTATWTAIVPASPPPIWAPAPPALPTATFSPEPRRTSTPWPTPTVFPGEKPRPVAKRNRLMSPTPTPFPDFGTISRADPFEKRAPAVTANKSTFIPTRVVTTLPAPAQAQTIVFQNLPANIYISFADGPGIYALEVVDRSGKHLRNLFQERVVAQEDDWVEWDGKDDAGQDLPPGPYTVLYTKNGRELKRLILVKTADP